MKEYRPVKKINITDKIYEKQETGKKLNIFEKVISIFYGMYCVVYLLKKIGKAFKNASASEIA